MTTLYEIGRAKLVQLPKGLAFYVGADLVWSSHKLRSGKAFPIVEARRLYGKGWSLEKIARRLGYTFSGVHYQMKKAGVQFRSRGGPRKRA